ncbi:MAG: GGDEF domain-containing protein [Nitrospirae bacterium]|nr:GGDEF domain-containing protein [Nitrospirota bacterium]
MPDKDRQATGASSTEQLAAENVSLRTKLDALTLKLEEKQAELDAAKAEIDRLMDTDPLTGLFNRKAFMEELVRAVSFARRSNLPLTILMGDMDNFKFILDTYGHEIRDKVLVAFAGIMNKHTRTEDIAARFSGDEFLLILPNTAMEQAMFCAERLWEGMNTLTIEGVSARLAASFGLTELRPEDDVKTLMKRADEALFKAKTAWPKHIATL